MKLFTIEDQNRLSEARKECEQKVLKLAETLISGRLSENAGLDIGEELMAEAHKLEKLSIVEAVSDQDFDTLQKNYRSLLRPIGSLVKNLAGTDLASKLDAARIEGVEIMNDLYDDIKNVEQGVSNPVKNKELSALRDKLAKNFADTAILVKGAMALADLFGDDPASLGGYTQMKEIISSLQSDDLTSVPLKQAFAAYQQAVEDNALTKIEKDDAKHDDWFDQGDNIDWVSDTSGGEVPTSRADMMARPRRAKKPGFFSRLFGRRAESSYVSGHVISEDDGPKTVRGGFAAAAAKPAAGTKPVAEKDPFPQADTHKDPFPSKPAKQSPMEKKFRALLQKTMVEKSPGFARMVNIPALIDTLMGKSYDHLVGIFGRFNDLVSNDVDVNFLNQVIHKPLTVGKALKSVWDSFTSGTMGGVRGRPV